MGKDYEHHTNSVPYLSGICNTEASHVVTLEDGTKGYGATEEEALEDAKNNQ